MKFLFFILTASLLLALNYAFDAETEYFIDILMEEIFMKENRIPGVGLAVVQNGTVLMSKGYGMKNITSGLAADANTLFAIGSISKVKKKIVLTCTVMFNMKISQSFIAVLVVKTLNELYPKRGAAVLDVPLVQLIPSTVNFTLSDRYRAEQTTFRDILSHRTCLSNGGLDLIFGTLPSASEYA